MKAIDFKVFELIVFGPLLRAFKPLSHPGSKRDIPRGTLAESCAEGGKEHHTLKSDINEEGKGSAQTTRGHKFSVF